MILSVQHSGTSHAMRNYVSRVALDGAPRPRRRPDRAEHGWGCPATGPATCKFATHAKPPVKASPAGTLAALGPPLEALYRGFDHVESATDPIHIVRRYKAPEDREIVGFIASGLAFGRVVSVLQSVEALLAVMGPHPAAFVRSFDPASDRKSTRLNSSH